MNENLWNVKGRIHDFKRGRKLTMIRKKAENFLDEFFRQKINYQTNKK